MSWQPFPYDFELSSTGSRKSFPVNGRKHLTIIAGTNQSLQIQIHTNINTNTNANTVGGSSYQLLQAATNLYKYKYKHEYKYKHKYKYSGRKLLKIIADSNQSSLLELIWIIQVSNLEKE